MMKYSACRKLCAYLSLHYSRQHTTTHKWGRDLLFRPIHNASRTRLASICIPPPCITRGVLTVRSRQMMRTHDKPGQHNVEGPTARTYPSPNSPSPTTTSSPILPQLASSVFQSRCRSVDRNNFTQYPLTLCNRHTTTFGVKGLPHSSKFRRVFSQYLGIPTRATLTF